MWACPMISSLLSWRFRDPAICPARAADRGRALPRQADDSTAATPFWRVWLGFTGIWMLCSSPTCWFSCRTWPSSDRFSSAWLVEAGACRLTCPAGCFSAVSWDRLTDCSHGALSVSLSNWLARPDGGSQRRGGATTIDRPRLGCSAAIIAVSARNCCATEKAVAFEAPELAEPMIWVILSSDSRTFRAAPSPSGVVVCALAVYCTWGEGGMVVLSSTTELIPSLAARFSSTL